METGVWHPSAFYLGTFFRVRYSWVHRQGGRRTVYGQRPRAPRSGRSIGDLRLVVPAIETPHSRPPSEPISGENGRSRLRREQTSPGYGHPTVTSPVSVRHVSLPRPPSIESPGAPSCASRTSGPFPPRSASRPGPPVIRSLPLPPMIESLPSSPVSTSLPFWPKITSFPLRPLIVSRPLPPQMMSSPSVPFSVSD